MTIQTQVRDALVKLGATEVKKSTLHLVYRIDGIEGNIYLGKNGTLFVGKNARVARADHPLRNRLLMKGTL